MDQKQPLESHARNEEFDSASNIYHIYHTGPYKNYYSIHTTSDSNTPLNLYPAAPANTQSPVKESQNSFCLRRSTTSSISKKVSRQKAFDNPKCDPRTETSPYFLHLPTLYRKNPPFTLRHGGKKSAPTAALLHCSAFWRNWKLEFGDVLGQPGVIDGRGVVNIKYGTKDGADGTLKGYEVRPKRHIGESGKAWYETQRETLGERSTESADKVKPEEVVTMRWTAPFSFRTREYRFSWRNFNFIWKGTQSVRPNAKLFHPFVHYNHLKLVVLLPGNGEGQQQELILARYTSAVAGRKAGRLEVYQHMIDSFLSEHMSALQQIGPVPNASLEENHPRKPLIAQEHDQKDFTKTSQRLRDIVMGTAMCMIIGEFTKRQVLIQVILALAGAYNG